MRSVVVVAIVMSLALAGCAMSSLSRGPAPFGSTSTFWGLTSFPGAPIEGDAILELEGQSLSLDIPCYRRSWAYNATTRRFTNAWESEPRCGETIPPVVELFDQEMPTVSDVRVSDDQLSLRDANGRLVLSGRRLISSGIENRNWEIEAYFDGHSVVRTRDTFNRRKASTVTFIHGSLHGSPGCGGLIGSYSAAGRQITIEAGVILAGTCLRRGSHRSVDEWPLNQPVLNALNGVRTVERRGERIILKDSTGAVQVVLAPNE